jgi:hypothetical protein
MAFSMSVLLYPFPFRTSNAPLDIIGTVSPIIRQCSTVRRSGILGHQTLSSIPIHSVSYYIILFVVGLAHIFYQTAKRILPRAPISLGPCSFLDSMLFPYTRSAFARRVACPPNRSSRLVRRCIYRHHA